MRAGGTFSGLTHVVAMAALLFGWPAFSLVFERTDDIDEPIDVLTYGDNADFKAAFRTGALINKTAEDLETKSGIDPDDISPTDTSGDAGFTSQGTAAADKTAAGRPESARDGDPDSPSRTRGRLPDDQAGTRITPRNDDDPLPAEKPSPDRAMREIVINVQVARLADLSAPQPEQRATTATLAALPMEAASARTEPPRDVPPAPPTGTAATTQPSAPALPTTPPASVAPGATPVANATADGAANPPPAPRLQIDAPAATQATAPRAVRSEVQPGTTGDEVASEPQTAPSAAPATEAAPARAVLAAIATVAAGDPDATTGTPRIQEALPRPQIQATESGVRSGDVPRPAPRPADAATGTPTPETRAPTGASATAGATAAGPAEPARTTSQDQPQTSPRPALAEAEASKLRDAPPTIVKVDAPRTPLDPASPDRQSVAAVTEDRPVIAPMDVTRPAPEAATALLPAAGTTRDERAQAVPPGQRAEPPRLPAAATDPLSRLAALAAGDDEVLRRLLQQETRPRPGQAPDGSEASRIGELPLSGAAVPTPGATQAARGTSARTDAVLREAAAAGNGKAALILAKRALRGEAPTVPAAEVEGLLRRAAERGEVEAQLLLAVVKARGIVVAQDRIEAHALLKIAAVMTGAISELATALPPDPARPKSPEARAVEAALAQVERQMSIEEVVKSQTVANAYRHALRVAPRGAQAGRFGTAGNTEMLDAAAAGSTATLAELLARGADIEGRDTTGRTAIINAAWRGRVEAIELLVALGADFDVVDSGGLTAVQWAASNGHTEAVERLVAAGASIDAADNDGRTALMRAAWNGHVETVAALLRAGASTRRTDAKGEAARDYAQRSGNKDVIRLLGGGT